MGFIFPKGTKKSEFVIDPSGRQGHYLHAPTDTVYSFGVIEDFGENVPVVPVNDITGKQIKTITGSRGVISEVGVPEDDDFFVRVLINGTEVSFQEADFQFLTEEEIKAWDAELEAEAKKKK